MLARLWAGAGDLVEWLAPDQELPEILWSRELVQARVAAAVLSRFQSKWLRYLPRAPYDWLDLLAQQVTRETGRLDFPTAHTDWPATISEFGRFPAQTYIERRPAGTFDTPQTRVLRSTCVAIKRADDLAGRQLGSRPLPALTQAMFSAILDLPAVAGAADQPPSLHDLSVCRSAGGVWLIIARLSDELSSIWSRDPASQINNLAPILPLFGHQLFELSTVGAIVGALQAELPGVWQSFSPIGAARKARPCLSYSSGDLEVEVYYQIVPKSARSDNTPYASTAKEIGGVLRPDIWIELRSPGVSAQFVVECKFSLDPSYVASGITQSMAYSLEFPAPPGISRRHLAVGPQEVVRCSGSDGGIFHLCNQTGAAELITEFAVDAVGG
jgi:hypothetical protein